MINQHVVMCLSSNIPLLSLSVTKLCIGIKENILYAIWYSFLTLYYITESYYKNYLGIVETNFF